MRDGILSWQLLAPTISLLLCGRPTTALPHEPESPRNEPRSVEADLSPWVTVNDNGVARTITPSLTTTNGAVVTVSPPPEYLTVTATWTLTVDGQVATSTGTNPVATGTGNGEEGAFLACNNAQGIDAPICQPREGAQLVPGRVIYVTWDPAHFPGSNTTVQVQGDYGSGEGFTSTTIPSSQGFYTWAIPEDFLLVQKSDQVPVNLSIATIGDGEGRIGVDTRERGPTVLIASSALDPGTDEPSGFSSNDTLIIALPSVVGILLLIGASAACFFIRRRKAKASPLGSNRFSGFFSNTSVYGRDGGDRPDAGIKGPGTTTLRRNESGVSNIQLTDRKSWSSINHPGRNIFREEMERQARERERVREGNSVSISAGSGFAE